MQSISKKIGCTAEMLRKWVKQAELDSGLREGVPTDERQRMKELERQVRELKRANEILRKASAYLAQAKLGRGLLELRWVDTDAAKFLVTHQHPRSDRTRRYRYHHGHRQRRLRLAPQAPSPEGKGAVRAVESSQLTAAIASMPPP